MVKYNQIIQFAKQVKENTEKKRSASIDSVRDYHTLAYLFSSAILRINESGRPRDTGIRRVKANPSEHNTHIDGGVGIKNCFTICKLMVNWVEKNNNQSPAYLKFKDYKIAVWVWTYATARILLYYDEHKKFPQKVLVTDVPFAKPQPTPKPTPKPKSYSEEIFDYFCSKFGDVGSIDEALEKVQGNGYGYYYDDVYSNRTSIDRMADGDGINCTDSCHVFWHIGKVLGYDVKSIHIMCRGGDGHIRLQFRHSERTGGNWINRDPAAVLDGNDVTSIWCANGEFLAEDPSWFEENLYR